MSNAEALPPQTTTSAFISYARGDAEFVHAFSELLRQFGETSDEFDWRVELASTLTNAGLISPATQ